MRVINNEKKIPIFLIIIVAKISALSGLNKAKTICEKVIFSVPWVIPRKIAKISAKNPIKTLTENKKLLFFSKYASFFILFC